MKRLTLWLAVVAGGSGCSSHPAVQSHATTLPTEPAFLADSFYDPDVTATVAPPLGWHTDPLKKNGRHEHQVWLSPTGHTAYGIIHFHLPLPVGNDIVLWAFLNEMKKSEGEATLISKSFDPSINALRFEAEGGMYHLRANLSVDGLQGWSIYAGTLRKFRVEQAELDQAIAAREKTRVGSNPEKGK